MGRAGTASAIRPFQVIQFVNNSTRPGPRISAAWIADRTTSELRRTTRVVEAPRRDRRGGGRAPLGRTRPITTSRTSRRARPITMWRPRSPHDEGGAPPAYRDQRGAEEGSSRTRRRKGKSYDLWWADLSAFGPAYAKTRQTAASRCGGISFTEIGLAFQSVTIDHSGVEVARGLLRGLQISHQALPITPSPSGATTRTRTRAPRAARTATGFSSIHRRTARSSRAFAGSSSARAKDFEYLTPPRGRQPPEDAGRRGCDKRDERGLVHDELHPRRRARSSTFAISSASASKEGERLPHADQHGPGRRAIRRVRCTSISRTRTRSRRRSRSSSISTWQKIGWDAYDAKKGYGWAGPFIGQPDHEGTSTSRTRRSTSSRRASSSTTTDAPTRSTTTSRAASTTSRCRSAGRARRTPEPHRRRRQPRLRQRQTNPATAITS